MFCLLGAGTYITALGSATVPPVAEPNFTLVEKLHYEFWYEPDKDVGLQFKLKIYKECNHFLGGSANYVHDYFSNPFIRAVSAHAEVISGRKRRTVYNVEKYNYKGPGIIYSESDHYSYLIRDLNPGDKTVSTVVYHFRDSRSIIPIFYAEDNFIKELKVTFRIPNGIQVNPYFYLCDSGDFKITRIPSKKEEVLQIVGKDIRGVSKEKNDDISSSYYAPFIYFRIKGGTVNNTTIYSLAGISDLYTHNYNFLKMTPPADTAKLRAITDTLTSDKLSQRENMEKIFNWVRENIKYIAIMEGKKNVVPESATDVLYSQYGDCKGMSSLLNGLAGAAKIPLHYGWVGTRDISFQPSDIPIPYAFDHMIAVYIEGKDTLVLDATSKSACMGEVSSRLYGKEVMINISDTEHVIYKIPTPEPSRNKLKVNVRYSPNDPDWKASYTADIEGQKKILFNYLNKMPVTAFIKNKRPNPVFPEMKTEDMSISEMSDNNQPKAKMTWQQPLQGVVKTSNSLLINPFPDKYKELLSIDTKERKMPIEVDYPFHDEIIISVEIPEGYVLSSQPPELAYSGTLGEITCHTKQEGNTVIAEFSLIVKPILIQPQDFEQFTNLKDILKKCISEYIVLKKQE